MKNLSEHINEAIVKKPRTTEYIGVGLNRDFVDMGFKSGVKWCTCNLGAKKPEEQGNFYQWACTEPTKHGMWSDYKWVQNGDPTKIIKYNDLSHTEIEPNDDAATVELGKHYHIPSLEEWDELNRNVTVTRTDDGVILTSKINGNKIYIPHTGRFANNVIRKPEDIILLSSELSAWDINRGDYTRMGVVSLTESYTEFDVGDDRARRIGIQIRPIYK